MTYNLCPVSKQIALLRACHFQRKQTVAAAITRNGCSSTFAKHVWRFASEKPSSGPLHAKSEAWLSRGKLDYCCKLSQSS